MKSSMEGKCGEGKCGAWKPDAKADSCRGQGPAMHQKQPAVGVMPGSGGVSSQENPRRVRRENYTPKNANSRRDGRAT